MGGMPLKTVGTSEIQDAIAGAITKLMDAKYDCEIMGIRYKGDEAQVRMRLKPEWAPKKESD